MRRFGGLDPSQPVEFFLERVTRARDFAPALARWKALAADGWDVTALAGEDGGQVVELVGLGCRYVLEPALCSRA